MSTDGSKQGSGPQDNVPQESVQTNPNWDTGGEKTPSQAQQDRHWQQVSDDNRDAGTASPTTGTPDASAPSLTGQHDRNPSTYGGMAAGLPASGATTNPNTAADAEKTGGSEEPASST